MKQLELLGQKICIIVFLILLTFPLLAFDRNPGHISVLENKNTAKFPDLSAYSSFFNSQLVKDFDIFLTDNIGLKEQGILTYISLMYKLFHQLEITNFIEGKENNVFYITKEILSIYQGIDSPPQIKFDILKEKLRKLNDTVKSVGATFIFMPIPNKEEIYPEYMPDNIHVLTEESFLNTLKNQVIIDGCIPTVDVEQALLRAKTNVDEMLYFRNMDASHWNANGMFVGYEALMRTMQVRDTSIIGLSSQNVLITTQTIHLPFSYLARYPSIRETFSQMNDQDYNISSISGFSGMSDNSHPIGYSLSGDKRNLYFYYHNDKAYNKKTIMVCGDSYIWTFMLPLLSETFTNVYFLAAGLEAPLINEFLNYVTPDIVVFQCVARMVNANRFEYLIGLLQVGFETHQNSIKIKAMTLLPMLKEACAIEFDNVKIQADHSIQLSNNETDIIISGWGIDTIANAPIGVAFLQIGEEILPASSMKRPDLGERYMDAGFYVSIPRKTLLNASEIKVFVTNTAKNALFPPIILPILPR